MNEITLEEATEIIKKEAAAISKAKKEAPQNENMKWQLFGKIIENNQDGIIIPWLNEKRGVK